MKPHPQRAPNLPISPRLCMHSKRQSGLAMPGMIYRPLVWARSPRGVRLHDEVFAFSPLTKICLPPPLLLSSPSSTLQDIATSHASLMVVMPWSRSHLISWCLGCLPVFFAPSPRPTILPAPPPSSSLLLSLATRVFNP